MFSFLLEVGTEELPASFVASALEQWRSLIPNSLKANLLQGDTTTVQVLGTPRRLAVLIKGLPQRQPDQEEEIKGPSVQAAFKDGQPTKAAMGFARSRNVDIADFDIRATDKGEFVFVRQKITGRPTAELLTELIPQWIFGLEGKRFMRWGDGDLRFSRPIRWLVALLEDQVLPLTLENGATTISSDRISWGHRVLHPEPVTLLQAEDYLTALENAYVLVDSKQRQERILEQLQVIEKEVKGIVPPDAINDLIEEVTHLVEWPNAVLGKFDAEFLTLPKEVTITVMKTHQRYFPVFDRAAFSQREELILLPYFITLSNGDPAQANLIALGNARVIRARLADAKFFYDADRAQPLEAYVPRLGQVTFQQALGSMYDKVQRMLAIAQFVCAQIKVPETEQQQILRATLLCKADLVTQMVGEFPELQGIMGADYARLSGEAAMVAEAIAVHYLPPAIFTKTDTHLVGEVVTLVDRLDTLVSIFGLGLIPSGSSDPFALRRAANLIIRIIYKIASKNPQLQLNLQQLLQQCIEQFTAKFAKSTPAATLLEQLEDFFLQRIRNTLDEDEQIDYDLINAILGEADPEYTQRALASIPDTIDRAKFLQQMRQDGSLDRIYETVNRASRLARQGDLDTVTLDPASVIQTKLLKQPSEQAFYQALVDLLPQTKAAQASRNYRQLVEAIAAIAPTVSRFFDGPESVLVMDENLENRRNRLNLLGLLRNHARVLADFGAIVKS
uniref:Glycine--tRNA ligase beta subunit n=1 Tax=Cyanothece sp. (strain PCC 7425 / ATCC 29141) TaxID=395961 RepID=B8HKQ1_CYAP4